MNQIIFCVLLCISLSSSLRLTCNFAEEFSRSSNISLFSPELNYFNIGEDLFPGFEFDAISFKDLTLIHGDIQGRVAIKGNLEGRDGISIADQITLDDFSIKYSLIVGNNVNWVDSGEVFPSVGSLFIGGSSVLPSYVAARVAGNCSSFNGSGCLDSVFDNVATFWTHASKSTFTAGSSNVDWSILYGSISLSCRSSAQLVNFVAINATSFSKITGYHVDASCNIDAIWVFNIGGEDNVRFDGISFGVTGIVIYNIIANELANRLVVAASDVYGNIVAPTAQFNQTGGTVYGQVIAQDFLHVIQINRPTCPSSSTTGDAATTSEGAATGSVDLTSDSTGSMDTSSSSSGDLLTTGVDSTSTTIEVATTGAVAAASAGIVTADSFATSGELAVESGVDMKIPSFIFILMALFAVLFSA